MEAVENLGRRVMAAVAAITVATRAIAEEEAMVACNQNQYLVPLLVESWMEHRQRDQYSAIAVFAMKHLQRVTSPVFASIHQIDLRQSMLALSLPYLTRTIHLSLVFAIDPQIVNLIIVCFQINSYYFIILLKY